MDKQIRFGEPPGGVIPACRNEPVQISSTPTTEFVIEVHKKSFRIKITTY